MARTVASGVSSGDPVLQLASGLNGPDDLLYTDDGTVLVGEHTDGHIARVGGAAGLQRLAQVVPEAEGIAQVGGVTYIADQYNARIVALTDTGVRTVLQLAPVASGENLDGISADLKGSGLVVPDSPHGTVLFVDTSGQITGRIGGFSRPAGSWPDPQGAGYLIADENASAVFELKGNVRQRLAGDLSGVDDAVRDDSGHVLAILPGSGRIYDLTSGANVASGLRNPQGLGFDAAQNILVTESDNGRLDLVVKTFAITTPPANVQLTPGQPVCFGLVRAPGFTDPVQIQEVLNGVPTIDPAADAPGQLVPGRCDQPTCTVTLILQSGSLLEYAWFTYRD
ncbi:MAG: hypothetical protein ABI334_05540 [Candidatus Dormiibacterota bacterium]